MESGAFTGASQMPIGDGIWLGAFATTAFFCLQATMNKINEKRAK
jgi:hypothetical protein